MPETRFVEADQLTTLASVLRDTGAVIESTIRGESMEPTVPLESRIRIDCSGRDCRVGDVVAFLAGSTLVAHRVVRVMRQGEILLTRGDGEILTDRPIPTSVVLGHVIQIETREGWTPIPDAPAWSGATLLVSKALETKIAWAVRIHPNLAVAVSAVTYLVRRGYRAFTR